jgi:coenzyme F420-0:L-glutamate ligase/coenzyme F420-1:gamma-L-glutamate ligase
VPEVKPGDDLGALLADAVEDGDVLVVAQKAVSKAEGRLRPLSEVEAGERARQLAEDHGKDPRLVQVVLDETVELMRAERGVLICRTRHGFVCANAGVDLSNVPGSEVAVLLPDDPDASARRIRAGLGKRAAVVVSDSFGRAWRLGQVDVALGAAGLAPINDLRGEVDAHGRELRVTELATADALAAAADLARGKASGEPAVIVRGLARLVTDDDGPGARALLRDVEEDLFR